MPKPRLELTGQRFGRLLALREEKRVNKRIIWLCQCDCGETPIVSSGHLRSGHTQSCGCLHSEICGRGIKERTVTHGLSKHPIYNTYQRMLQRCNNPNSDKYENYGNRGIQVKWETVEDFVKDMLPTWEPGLSIDRIDNDGDYEPGNCRWATPEIQNQNQRTTKLTSISVSDIRQLHKEKPSLSQADIAKRFGVSRRNINFVLTKQTWMNVA